MTAPPPPPIGARYGVVDMGSNAIRVQVVEHLGDGLWNVLESHRAPVRLGREVFLTGRIPERTQAEAIDVYRRFAQTCAAHKVDHVHAIATSATREAMNGDLFIGRIKDASGIEVDVISGTQEAFFLKSAVETAVDLSRGRAVLVDVGGGSVEVVLVEDGHILSAASYQVGALRIGNELSKAPSWAAGADQEPLGLPERYLANLVRRLRDSFGPAPVDQYVATGGNIDALADLIDARGAGRTTTSYRAYPVSELTNELGSLAVLSHDQRVQDRGLRPDRADTILAAGAVYARVGEAAATQEVLVPGVGVRDGLLREMARGHPLFDAVHHADVVLASCRAVGQRLRLDTDHGDNVRHLAAELLDGLRALGGLGLETMGPEDRVLLQVAAYLHDVGEVVGTPRHHEHSEYLIRQSNLIGLTSEQQDVVAQVAKYHREAPPQTNHAAFEALNHRDRVRVQQLAAILRIADALDRRHQQIVEGIQVTADGDTVRLRAEVHSPLDLTLERGAVETKRDLFQDVFGRSIGLDPEGVPTNGSPNRPGP